jgi:hypothetical protein
MWESMRVCNDLRFLGSRRKSLNSRSSAVDGGEDGDIAAVDQVLQGLQQGGFLDKLGVVGLEEGDEDRVGVDLGGVGWALIIGKCMNNITRFEIERSC